jgi:catechol 2,3-dioxygenase-like lactoylglutathione lyase family enzyme
MQRSTPTGNEGAGQPAHAGKGTNSPELDHVGVLVRDLPAAVAAWAERFNVGVVRRFEAPDLDLSAVFLDVAGAAIELYTLHDDAALDRTLGARPATLDHVALRLRGPDGPELSGCVIRGPGRLEPIAAPIHLAGAMHVWTEPPGIDVLLQLITPSVDAPY